MNRGLILISPVILVRLLTVEDFGRYREFLLYVGILTTIAAFGINNSLLRFVPSDPRAGWRFVDQAVLMTFASSIVVTGGMLVANVLMDGKLVGDFAIPLALYVLFFVNMDFWEPLYLAEKRPFAVLRYTTVRLVARIAVVTITAALTRDIETIIASLVCLEAVRLLISTVAWRVRARAATPTDEPRQWREQLQYILPFGSALILVTLNRSMGSLFVAKVLGPVALAHYAIGTYLQPVISVIRNSLSDVVLPEMASQRADEPDRLGLWRRTTVITAVLLVATGVLLARFADIIVVTLFSEAYRPAVVLFQIYLLVFLREAVDFSIPLRTVNRTSSILYSNIIAIAVNVGLMFLLMPRWGTSGAVAALVISRFVEGVYLARKTAVAYHVSVRELAPWGDLGKVLAAALLAAIVLSGSFWTEILGLAGVVLGSALYCVLFVLLLIWMRVPEAGMLVRWVRAAPAIVTRRSQ